MIKRYNRLTGLVISMSMLFAMTSCGNNTIENNPVKAEIESEKQTEMKLSDDRELNQMISAKSFVSGITVGWNVGNSLDSFGTWINDKTVAGYETAWGNPQISNELIKYVKGLGFNTVRIPVTYAQNMDGQGNINSSWLSRVREVVDYCIEQDMYCIINIHHDTGAGDLSWLKANSQMYDAGMKDKFVKVWSQIAEYFKDYDDRLVFEGFNEILDINSNWGGTDSASYEIVNKLNQDFIDTVRKSGGNNQNRNLIVNAYGASNWDSQLDGFKLPSDTVKEHLLASVHIYSPQQFCDGDDASFDEQDKKQIEQAYARVVSKLAKRWNIPVIVGECGVNNKLKTESFSSEIAKYYKCMLECAKNSNMAVICWDNGSDMGLIDRKGLALKESAAVKAIFETISK